MKSASPAARIPTTAGPIPGATKTWTWLSWTKALTRLRTAHDALQTGRFIPLYADGDVFAFARVIEGGRDVFGKPAEDGIFIIAMNRNPSAADDQYLYGRPGLRETDQCSPSAHDAGHDGEQPPDPDPAAPESSHPPGEGAGTKRAGVLLHPTSLPAAVATASWDRRHTASSISSKPPANGSGRSCP